MMPAPHHLEPALPDGQAAELAAAAALLPLQPHAIQSPVAAGVCWRCDLALPAPGDLRAPRALAALRPLLEETIPALASRALGRTLRPARPGVGSFWALRKGAWYARAASEDVGVTALLELTGAAWPALWGGHLQSGAHTWALGWDRLSLLEARQPLSVSLLTRHVEATFLHIPLVGG